MLTIAVTGGRYLDAQDWVFSVLDDLDKDHGIRWVVTGGADGADDHARLWAMSRGVTMIVFPALWAHHGAKAGPIRNQEMLSITLPDVLVAFPGGRDTAHCKKTAEELGIPVWEYQRS